MNIAGTRKCDPSKALAHFCCTIAGFMFFSLSVAGPQVAAQEIKIDFIPPQSPTVDEQDYRKGKYILENTYTAIKDDDGDICYADLWNVGIGYSHMGVDHDSIMLMFRESKRMDPQSFCEILGHATARKGLDEYRLVKLLGQPFRDLVRDCSLELKPVSLEQRMAEKRSQDLDGLDEDLIDQLLTLIDQDQRYRYSSKSYEEHWDEQNELDRKVQAALAKLFDVRRYPGRSLVGERYAGHACLLLEHGGDLAHQEKYLPLVTEAFKQGEVPRCCFLMLIDRIHWKKTKKQIFGSHVGVPLDSDEVIQRTKEEIGW